MTAEENIRVQLRVLMGRGSMARSACSGSLLKTLKPLFDSSVVVEERSGAGRHLVLRDAVTFREFVCHRFPEVEIPADVPTRVAGVADFRDSKTHASNTPDVLVLRAWSDTALWCGGQPVQAAQATSDHGIFSFVLDPRKRYELRVPCALVENPAVLLSFELLQKRENIPLALYGGGRISGRVLTWLAGQPEGFRLIHFPDYDPVGLSEFVRLRTTLGKRASLHLPDDLGKRFACFGNSELVRRPASQALLPKLRSAKIPELNRVLELIERHNAGLEQEALFL
jgi:hypothetical protein